MKSVHIWKITCKINCLINCKKKKCYVLIHRLINYETMKPYLNVAVYCKYGRGGNCTIILHKRFFFFFIYSAQFIVYIFLIFEETLIDFWNFHSSQGQQRWQNDRNMQGKTGIYLAKILLKWKSAKECTEMEK